MGVRAKARLDLCWLVVVVIDVLVRGFDLGDVGELMIIILLFTTYCYGVGRRSID